MCSYVASCPNLLILALDGSEGLLVRLVCSKCTVVVIHDVFLASSPGYSHILSHSREEKLGEGLGTLLRHGLEMVDSVCTNRSSRALNSSSRVSMAYTNALISLQNFQQLKSHSWTCAYTKGRDLSRKAFWISKPISSPLTPNNIYMPLPPTLPEQAGVSSRENYSDTFERTQMKLRSRCTKKSMLKTNRPTVAFRTHKSIRKQLTRARLEDSNITHKIDRELNLLC